MERRRDQRIDMRMENSRLLLLTNKEPPTYEHCALLNLSRGGMCLRTRHEIMADREYAFLLEIPQRMLLPTVARARSRWVKAVETGIFDAGMAFINVDFDWLPVTS